MSILQNRRIGFNEVFIHMTIKFILQNFDKIDLVDFVL